MVCGAECFCALNKALESCPLSWISYVTMIVDLQRAYRVTLDPTYLHEYFLSALDPLGRVASYASPTDKLKMLTLAGLAIELAELRGIFRTKPPSMGRGIRELNISRLPKEMHLDENRNSWSVNIELVGDLKHPQRKLKRVVQQANSFDFAEMRNTTSPYVYLHSCESPENG